VSAACVEGGFPDPPGVGPLRNFGPSSAQKMCPKAEGSSPCTPESSTPGECSQNSSI
jgi:hypothetical protein